MTESNDDFKSKVESYDIDTLYEILGNINKDKYPERYQIVKNEIARRKENPEIEIKIRNDPNSEYGKPHEELKGTINPLPKPNFNERHPQFDKNYWVLILIFAFAWILVSLLYVNKGFANYIAAISVVGFVILSWKFVRSKKLILVIAAAIPFSEYIVNNLIDVKNTDFTCQVISLYRPISTSSTTSGSRGTPYAGSGPHLGSLQVDLICPDGVEYDGVRSFHWSGIRDSEFSIGSNIQLKSGLLGFNFVE